MSHSFREQPKLRLIIGCAFLVVVWSLYFVRLIFGVGPAHDYAGNQAPAFHYLVCALIVTGMVAVWLVVRGLMMPRK